MTINGSVIGSTLVGALGGLPMAYIACIAALQGAVVWAYIGEVFPNRVRANAKV